MVKYDPIFLQKSYAIRAGWNLPGKKFRSLRASLVLL